MIGKWDVKFCSIQQNAGLCSIIEHDRITTPNVEHFSNAFQLTMLLLHIRVNFYFVQEITNFGNINTISIFTNLIFTLHAI